MKIHRFKGYPLSKLNTFDQNFMKIGHIVLYHDVFFKFDNGLYRTMLSAVMALCSLKFTVLNDVRSLSWIVLIRVLWNLVTLFSTRMSSSSLIMVYMAPCFNELLPLLYETLSVEVCDLRWIVLIIILWNLVILLSTKCLQVSELPISHHAFGSYCPLLMTIPYLCEFGNSGVIRVLWTHF